MLFCILASLANTFPGHRFDFLYTLCCVRVHMPTRMHREGARLWTTRLVWTWWDAQRANQKAHACSYCYFNTRYFPTSLRAYQAQLQCVACFATLNVVFVDIYNNTLCSLIYMPWRKFGVRKRWHFRDTTARC